MNHSTNQITDTTFSSFDLHFAEFLYNLSSNKNEIIYISAALVSNALQNGHTCIDLSALSQTAIPQSNLIFHIDFYPDIGLWKSDLLSSGIVGQVGQYFPLILECNRLYIYRYWAYENDLAQMLLSMAETSTQKDIIPYKEYLESLFPDVSDLYDLQYRATLTAIFNRCTVISGGPGTGKTSTVVKIIASLLIVFGKDLRIALCAPTGKAAARLSSSITISIEKLNCPDDIKKLIPCQATTIHRLLGVRTNSPEFFFNQTNPLPYDVLIIDEASMIDLALMSKCLRALKSDCKLILLGDKDQLSSVEAGAVLGDICDTGVNHLYTHDYYLKIKIFLTSAPVPISSEPVFANSLVTLQRSYRFSENSGIGLLSRAVNEGNVDLSFQLLKDSNQIECTFKSISTEKQLIKNLYEYANKYYAPLLKINDPLIAFSHLDKFRFLNAVRNGPFGVESVNMTIMNLLLNKKVDYLTQYHGKPIIITSNSYTLNVFNGDTAILMKTISDTSSIKASFRTSENMIHYLHPNQLPHFEPAYSMTVHKSQGSEFDHVILILPPQFSPVLTRELLYTAITRAKKSVEIWGTEEILKKTIASKISRSSGLCQKIWKSAN